MATPTPFFARLLNVAPHEFSRVAGAFSLKFFFHTTEVLGHAVLVALFAARVGIESLPLFFMVSAGLILAGTAVAAPVFQKFSPENRIGIFSVAGVAAAASGALIGPENPALFFGFLLVGASVFFHQILIAAGLLIESKFSPLEAERCFPVIESAELFGRFVGGLAVTILAGGIFHFHAESLLWVWAGLGVGIFLANFFWQKFGEAVPAKFLEKLRGEPEIPPAGPREFFAAVRAHFAEVNFLKFLLAASFLLAIAMPLAEFEYTRALAGHFHDDAEHLLHGLGMYTIALAGVGIFFQIFAAGRLTRALGIVRTMAVHPAAAFAGFAGLAVAPGLGTAVGGKFLFDLSRQPFLNAFAASFYAVPEKIRLRTKPFFEGWGVPAGALLGTGALFFAGKILPAKILAPATHAVMILAVLGAGFFLWKSFPAYTDLAVKNLRGSDRFEKHNAIEVLGQRGHRAAADILHKNLAIHRRDPAIRRRIIEVLGELRDIASIPVLLDFLSDPDRDVLEATVRALSRFRESGSHFFAHAFSHHRVNEELKKLFKETKSKTLKLLIIQVFAQIGDASVVPFLLEVLHKTRDPEFLGDVIAVIGHFHDPSIAHYLEPFLAHPEPTVRAATVIALWQFPSARIKLNGPVIGLLADAAPASRKAAIYLLGETRARHEERKLLSILDGEDRDLADRAAFALGKLGHPRAEEPTVGAIFTDRDAETREKIWRHFCRLEEFSPAFFARAAARARHEAARRLHGHFQTLDPAKLPDDARREIRFLLGVMGKKKEMAWFE